MTPQEALELLQEDAASPCRDARADEAWAVLAELVAAQPPVLDVRPRPMEVAVAWLPPGTRLSVAGEPLRVPGEDEARYAEIGWDQVSGGARLAVHGSWQALRNGRRPEERPVWAAAAGMLRAAASKNPGAAAVYVVIEARTRFSRTVLAAARVRREGAE